MTTKVDLSAALMNLKFLGILYQMELNYVENKKSQQGSFDDLEWNYFINILLKDELIEMHNKDELSAGFVTEPIYEITEGGKLFLQRLVDLTPPKKTMKPVWE